MHSSSDASPLAGRRKVHGLAGQFQAVSNPSQIIATSKLQHSVMGISVLPCDMTSHIAHQQMNNMIISRRFRSEGAYGQKDSAGSAVCLLLIQIR